jgi:Zn-dependent peptidase ImmA (M78 family)
MANPVNEGQKAARDLRRRLDLGQTAPVDVTWIARKLGVVVVRKRLADGLSGVHLAHGSGRSFVAVNSSDIASRQNFTLAHELGHHEFDHGHVIVEKIDFTDAAPIEKRANAFAAELILPAKAVEEWRSTPHLQISANEVARLAATYRMSYLATLYRLKSCGAIEDIAPLQEARDSIDPVVRKLLNLPVENPFELPTEFLRMADEALSRSIISRKRHAELTTPEESEPDF